MQVAHERVGARLGVVEVHERVQQYGRAQDRLARGIPSHERAVFDRDRRPAAEEAHEPCAREREQLTTAERRRPAAGERADRMHRAVSGDGLGTETAVRARAGADGPCR